MGGQPKRSYELLNLELGTSEMRGGGAARTHALKIVGKNSGQLAASRSGSGYTPKSLFLPSNQERGSKKGGVMWVPPS